MLARPIRLLLGVFFLFLLGSDLARANPPARSDGKTTVGLMRTWSDVSGTHNVQAALVDVVDGKVQLKKADGKIISVPLDKLSEFDQRWLAKQPPPTPTAVAVDVVEAEWPGWRGPNRDGKSPDTGLLKEWPADGPKLLWKVTGIGKGYSGVAVSAGTVYITGDVNDKLRLFAYDMEGKLKWQVDHGPTFKGDHPGARATPTVDGGKLYLLSDTGLLVCYDVLSGRTLWSKEAQKFGGTPGRWGYAESVLIDENRAVFKPGGANCIVALDKAKGHEVWSSKGFAAGPEYSSCLAFTYERQPMIVTGTSEGLICVGARNGGLLWGNKFSAGNIANCPTPAYSDGYVFWANGYGKGGICVKLGRNGKAAEAWTTKDLVCHHGGYIIDKGYIYGSNEHEWVCLDLKTGQKKWAEKGVGKGSLCWADGMLYLFGENGGKAALATCSPDGLQIKGKVKVDGDGPSWAHPVVIGGRLYLRYDENLYCFAVR
jgi:outer membrane protein assembly factor BamB